MNLRYDIVGTGWAERHIEFGGQQATVSASYVSDALDDLCAALIAVLRGDKEAEASFVEKPGEFRWQLERRGSANLRIVITEYAEMPSANRRASVAVLLDAEAPLLTFASAVLSELQRLEADDGGRSYAEKWHLYPFPATRIPQLKALLS